MTKYQRLNRKLFPHNLQACNLNDDNFFNKQNNYEKT